MMDAVTVMRRLQEGGIPHDQAKVMAEVLADEIESTVATKDFVRLVVEAAKTDRRVQAIGRLTCRS